VRAGRTPAHGRIVHDVVVVEGGEVDELDGGGRVDDLVARTVAQLSGQQDQQGAHPLAAGLHEVVGRLVRQPLRLGGGRGQPLLDPVQAGGEVEGQRGVRRREGARLRARRCTCRFRSHRVVHHPLGLRRRGQYRITAAQSLVVAGTARVRAAMT
jgi:hypothetical protein